MVSGYAQQMLNEEFKNCFYIGRVTVDKDPKRKPYKFFWVGHEDLFGVAMSEAGGRWGFQLWGANWVTGRSKKLDGALVSAIKGKFIDIRHNIQLKRAISNGSILQTEIKAAATSKEEAKEKLPIRGRRRRRLKV